MQLSIIIPMYNASRFIATLINSIYNQENYDVAFEVIIVDDCSHDNSVELINQYCKYYDNLKLIKAKQNGGTASARNLGIKQAQGKWIQFLDSDDYLQANYFQLIAPKLKLDVDCLIYGISFETIDCIKQHSPLKLIDQRMIGYKNSVCNKIYQRKIIVEFEPNYAFEDVIWLVHLIGKTKLSSMLIDNLYYHVNRGNIDSKMACPNQSEWYKMASATISESRNLNQYARMFVLETFVGTLFTNIYRLDNRLKIACKAVLNHYRYLPQVVTNGIRNQDKIEKRNELI